MSHFSADAAEFQPSGTAWQLDAVGDALAAGSEAEQPQEMGLSPLVASAVAALGSLDGAALLQLAHGDQATLERTCLQLLGLPPPPTEPPTAPEQVPCKYYMQGGCYRSKCFYSHDLSNIRCTYFDKGLCIKGDACPFMHDEALDEIRQALPWLVPLMAHGQPEFLVQVAAPYFSDAKHEAPQNQDNAAEAPELSSAEAFPPLHEGIPLIAMAADSEAASDWSGAKHIAFRQVTNAFCNSLVGQDEGSLLRVFDDCGGNIKKTFETLLSEGCRPNKQWLRQEYEKHYLGQRAAKFSSQPPPVPDIAWVETGATVGAAYAKLREEATNLAKLRNRCLQQAALAYRANDGKAAKEFAQQGREYDRRMREKHHEAAQEMRASRRGQCTRDDVIDLHGLHVQEALDCLDDFVASRPDLSWIYVITGTGHHSDHRHLGHQRRKARLLPAVLEWAAAQGWAAKDVGGTEHGGLVRLHIVRSRGAADDKVPEVDEATMIRAVLRS